MFYEERGAAARSRSEHTIFVLNRCLARSSDPEHPERPSASRSGANEANRVQANAFFSRLLTMPSQHNPEAIRAALAADRTIDILTTGARTGRTRVTEIWFCRLDDALIVTGTPGPRDWYANLLKHPDFIFRLKESLQADLPARATPILDPERRRAIFTHVVTQWYRDRAGIDALVAGSPLVDVKLVVNG